MVVALLPLVVVVVVALVPLVVVVVVVLRLPAFLVVVVMVVVVVLRLVAFLGGVEVVDASKSDSAHGVLAPYYRRRAGLPWKKFCTLFLQFSKTSPVTLSATSQIDLQKASFPSHQAQIVHI